MAKIYKIKSDIDAYMYFSVDDMDVCEKMEDFDIKGFGQPLKFMWNAPVAMFDKSDTGSVELPSLTIWAVKVLIANKAALKLLKWLLRDDVIEAYPLKGKYDDYMLVNPVIRLDNKIVDLERTVSSYFDDGAWNKLEKLVLKSSMTKEAPPLFTLEYERGLHLYCNESFKHDVEKHKLKGLVFSEIEVS